MRQLWALNGIKSRVADDYARFIRAFVAYCANQRLEPHSALTAAEANKFSHWYNRVQRLRAGSKYRTLASPALRANAWTLSSNGFSVPDWAPAKAKEPAPGIVERYIGHAREHRGLAKRTTTRDRWELIQFMGYLRKRHLDWRRLGVLDIDLYPSGLTTHLGPATIRRRASAIRGWLRFLFATGRLRHDVTASIVSPVRRLHDRPPRALPWPAIKRIHRAIEPATAIGRRDRAQFLLMSAYGLGGAEVLQLQLSDIDWTARRFRIVRQKTKVEIWLLLLPEVGRALADYIRNARPNPTEFRQVFLSRKRPFRPFASSGSSVLSDRVRRLAKRAGIKGRILGAHLFRHSHATRQVVIGTEIETLADILGHRHPETTSIYTRAAVQRLRRLALPVPK